MIIDRGGNTVSTNEFTVYVRECGWLIRTIEDAGNGMVQQREVGSTNGTVIYEFSELMWKTDLSKSGNLNAPGSQRNTAAISVNPPHLALVYSNNIPVGRLDNDMVSHLWLMFASQCYWGSQHTDQLTPVYDFEASFAGNSNLKVTAKWELLNGLASLPREVTYLGEWGETNGLYRVTGTNSVGGMLVPNGFVFEERVVGQLSASSLVHELVVRKRVEAKVTSVQAVCSRKTLMPVLGAGPIVTGDWRLKKRGSGSSVQAT